MMKRTYQLLLITVCALLLVVACRKVNNSRQPDQNTFTPNTGGPPSVPTVSLNELFKEFRSTPEKQCVTAGILQTITFAKGTRLTFYPNSFKDAAGAIITSGTVCIEMIEMYKPGDMIANMATTSTKDNGLLTSGGQVSIKVTKDGKKVFANVYGIAFRSPASSSKPMELFYGDNNNPDSVVKWTPAGGGVGATVPGTTADSVEYHYIFDSCRNFDLINCDKIYVATAMKMVYVDMPDPRVNKDNIRSFVIVPELNAAIYIKWKEVGGLNRHWVELPINMSFSIVVMMRVGNTYYYYEKAGMSITDDIIETATFSEKSIEYITGRLKII